MLKPPDKPQGYVTRGVLEAELKRRRQELEAGNIVLPPTGTDPTGTGFRHMTDGTEDPVAKLVETADIGADQVTFSKLLNATDESVLVGRGEGAGGGNFEEITLGTGLSMAGNVLSATGGGGGGSSADEVFNTEDDGFDASSLDAKWTPSTTGTAPTVTYNPQEARSCLLAKFGAANGGAYWTQPFVPGSADFSFTAKFYAKNISATQIVHFAVMNTALTDGIRFLLYKDTSVHSLQYTEQPSDVNILTLSFSDLDYVGLIYFHIQRLSGNWTALYSFNRATWLVLRTSSAAKTIDLVKFGFDQGGATTQTRMACDWIRRDWFFW